MKRLFVLVPALFIAMLSAGTVAGGQPAIKVSVFDNRVRFADPVLLRVTLTYEVAPALRVMSAPLLYLPVEDLDLRVRRISGPNPSDAEYRFWRTRFAREDEKGLRSGANLTLWYRTRKGAKDPEIVFGTSGRYEIAFVDREDHLLSNTVRVAVEPSAIGERVLTQIAEPNDLKFLADGVLENPRAVAHLEEIVEQAQGTVLGRTAAARLGLTYFERFHREHSSFERFAGEYRRGARDTLFEKAREFLSIGAGLSIPFPIREEVLYRLSVIRFIEGDYDAAASLFAEMGRQFPQGKYGRRAAEAQAELSALRSRLSEPNDPRSATTVRP